MSHETFVGVVHDLSSDAELSIAILHPGNRTVAHGSWRVEAESYNPFETVDGGLRLKKEPHISPAGFAGIADFLGTRCGASTRILIEHPSRPVVASSAFSQFMAFLIVNGFGACSIDFDDTAIVHFRELSQEEKPEALRDDLIFLANSKAKAYAMVLRGRDTLTDQQYSTAAALVAMNSHLHFYLKSPGQIFSSQDIALFVKDPAFFNPLVIGTHAVYFLSKTSGYNPPDLSDIHLEYALAVKRFSFLPSGEALKFALLSTCKMIGLRLHCLSVKDQRADNLLDEEALGPDEYVAYDPGQAIPEWLGQL
jgi:hypothetical protein